MLITSYYRGATDKVSGVTFDTEKHTFKTWSLEPDDWSHTYRKAIVPILPQMMILP